MGEKSNLEEVKSSYCKWLLSRLNQLTLEIGSLIERLVGKGTEQDIEYGEDVAHNVLNPA